MAENKKPRKQHLCRWNGDGAKLRTQPHKVGLVFNPVYAIIDQLEQDGTVDVAPNGAPVFFDTKDGGLYDTYAAVSGLIEAHEIHERKQGRDLGMEPLRQLINKLKYGMPVSAADTRPARAALDRMRAENMNMTAEYAHRMLQAFRIKEGIERMAISPDALMMARTSSVLTSETPSGYDRDLSIAELETA